MSKSRDGVKASLTNASTRVRSADQRHPEHLAMSELVKEAPELRSIMKEIHDIQARHKVTPSLFRYDMESVRMQQLKRKFMEIYDKVDNQRPKVVAKAVDHRAAPSRVLYGRVGESTPFVDVGSGDAKRLVSFPAAQVTTCDPNFASTKIDAPHIQAAFTGTTSVITSFNAATQFADKSVLEQCDGIHVVPNLPALEQAGLSVQHDGVFITTIGEQQFEDHKWDVPSVVVSSQSLGVNTYAKEKLVVQMGDKQEGSPSCKSVGKRTGHLFADPCATVKLNGELVKLVVRGGQGFAVWRDSDEIAKIVCRHDMVINLEYAADRFFLINIESFRGYKPFHSYPQLRYFLERKPLTISYAKKRYPVNPPILYSPSVYRKLGSFAEGVVIRRDNNDLLLREQPSLDLTPEGVGQLAEIGKRDGFSVTVDRIEQQTCEYLVKFDGDHLDLVFVKRRRKRADDLSGCARHCTRCPFHRAIGHPSMSQYLRFLKKFRDKDKTEYQLEGLDGEPEDDQ